MDSYSEGTLRSTGRGDTRASGVQGAMDRVTSLLGSALNVATVSAAVVDSRGLFRASSFGVAEPISLLLSHAFQEKVPAAPKMLVVDDGPRDMRVARVPAVRDRTVRACVGIRVYTRNGRAVGTLLVMDSLPRQWTASQLAVVAIGAAQLAETVNRGAVPISGVGLRRDLFRAFRQEGSSHPGGGKTTSNRDGLASDPPDSRHAPGFRRRRLDPCLSSSGWHPAPSPDTGSAD